MSIIPMNVRAMRRTPLLLLAALCSGASSPKQDEPPHCHQMGPYIVFFESDSAELSREAKRTLDFVIKANESACSWPMGWLMGHADTRESPSLASTRTGAIWHYLRTHGWRIQAVGSKGYGASRPRIATPPGVSERQNRRVEIFYSTADGPGKLRLP
jgi:outer membrane protein OmpA-like peptidoglycan-associated protein